MCSPKNKINHSSVINTAYTSSDSQHSTVWSTFTTARAPATGLASGHVTTHATVDLTSTHLQLLHSCISNHRRRCFNFKGKISSYRTSKTSSISCKLTAHRLRDYGVKVDFELKFGISKFCSAGLGRRLHLMWQHLRLLKLNNYCL